MAHIVLVHGMAATKKSWSDLPRKLKEAGHEMTNVTLPGHGNILEFWKTGLSNYVDEVVEAMSPGGQSILIGHSMGGFVISQTAALHLSEVSQLIYVAAMMPKPGDTIGSLSARAGTDLNDLVTEFTKAGVGMDFLVPQPPGPLETPFDDSQGIVTVPRHYIHCTEDRIIPLELQSEMVGHWPSTSSVRLRTGHLPQFSEPDFLATTILEVIG